MRRSLIAFAMTFAFVQSAALAAAGEGNRLAYLQDSDPYYVDVDPPAVIEEAPPLERPQTSCEWVPGYWSYNDDARNWY